MGTVQPERARAELRLAAAVPGEEAVAAEVVEAEAVEEEEVVVEVEEEVVVEVEVEAVSSCAFALYPFDVEVDYTQSLVRSMS